MKRTSEEIINMLKEHEEGLGEAFIGLVEDIADSVVEPEVIDMSQYVEKSAYDELKQKYIDRFTSKETVQEVLAPTPKKDEYADVTIEDLFTEEE